MYLGRSHRGCGQHAGDRHSLCSFLISLWMPLENLFWEEEVTVCLSVSGSEKGQTDGSERFLNQRLRVVAVLAGSDSVGET